MRTGTMRLEEGRETEFDVDWLTGKLGRSEKSYQRTLKRKKGKTAWREVNVSASPEAEVQISFDGSVYSEPIRLFGDKLRLAMAARAVRIKVKRSAERVHFSIICRE